MKQATPYFPGKRFLFVGFILILPLLALGISLIDLTPVQASTTQPGTFKLIDHDPDPPARPHNTLTLNIQQSATTPASPGLGTVVYNGDVITYTITINLSGIDTTGTVTNVRVEDVFPANVFDIDVPTGCDPTCTVSTPTCTPACIVETIAVTLTDRDGNPLPPQFNILKPVKVIWHFDGPFTSSSFPLTLTFAPKVICQPQGSSFNHQPVLTYNNPDGRFQPSPPKQTTVQVTPPGQNGQSTFSAAPEICSTEGPIGGTLDMDWGDFDNDGDLDVALVSPSRGLFIYRNTGSGFELLTGNVLPGFQTVGLEGVRWGNFRGDGNLELLISGDWNSTNSPFPDSSTPDYEYTGFNYLFEYNGSNGFTHYHTFFTNDGAWRAEVADFTGNNSPDLAMINHWGGCTVHLYRNPGNGMFNRSDPTNTSTSFCLFSAPFDPDFSFPSDTNQCCNGRNAAYSAAWGDFDNSGDPDLAVAHRNGSDLSTTVIRVYRNQAGILTDAAPTDYVVVETNTASEYFYALDLVWGDYDRDGDLDLAAGFASDYRPDSLSSFDSGGFRVYRNNNNGASFTRIDACSITTDDPVGSIDWADFNGDGRLELVVAEFDKAPVIYQCDGGLTQIDPFQISGNRQIMAIRGIDYDNDGDLDLAYTNFGGESWIFTNTAPFLRTELTLPTIGSFIANDVAWGDLNGGFPDLLFGSTSGQPKVFLNNNNGGFTTGPLFSPNPPAQSVALGNLDEDTDLDAVLGLNGPNLIYLNTGTGLPTFFNWSDPLGATTNEVSLVDVNQDNAGLLDMIIGNGNGNAPNHLFVNQGTLPAIDGLSLFWQSAESEDTQAVAWGYYNDPDTNDRIVLPDFAAANFNQETRIYRNTGLNSFVSVRTLPAAPTRDVAWGDYDEDGDMDLALAVGQNQRNQLYRQDNAGNFTLVWTSTTTLDTTSVAWGDWDNDGDLDLAFGNANGPVEVYANLGSANQPNLFLLWESADSPNTTGIAWGDYDGDGDLDLAVSRNGGQNGIYENTYVLAPHLSSNFPNAMPLPQNPSYLRIARPSNTPDGVIKKTEGVTLTIPIAFTLFDPDLTRAGCGGVNGERANLVLAETQYSLNGGGQWFEASVSPVSNFISQCDGEPHTITWEAEEDLIANNNRFVSDDVRFRITIARNNNPTIDNHIPGPIQRARISAISPPFRIRNTSCTWPEDASFTTQPTTIAPNQPFTLTGMLGQFDEGQTTFNWNFGGGTSKLGQVVQHSFLFDGTYVITLTVTQEPCPVTRPTIFVGTVVVGTGIFPELTFLPIIVKSGTGATSLPPLTEAEENAPLLSLSFSPAAPGQVEGLRGKFANGVTQLEWQASPPEEGVAGYRVYRTEAGQVRFRLLAEVSAGSAGYTDSEASCGRAYLVTAYNGAGESLPSTSSFLNPPCR
jgi:hypothetical protein